MKQTPTKKTAVTQPTKADAPRVATAAAPTKGLSHQQVLMALNKLPLQHQKRIAAELHNRAAGEIRTIAKLASDRRDKEERKGLKSIVVPQSKKKYGTTTNGASHQVAKFSLNSMQAALLAWAHTVLNPRTLNPHPVPMGAFAGGSSAAEARMYQVTLYGTAVVNAAGAFWILVNADGWASVVPQDPIIPSQTATVYAQYLTYPSGPGSPIAGASTSTPVTFTDQAWAGEGSLGTTGADCPNMFMHNAPFTDDGSTIQAQFNGLQGCEIPGNFCPAPFGTSAALDARYNMVSTELRLRPEGKLVDQSGDIGIFNWRGTPTRNIYPTAMDTAPTYDDMLTIPDTFLSRHRLAVADWPSNKWLSAVANPNTVCCFSQPLIQPASYRSNSGVVGFNNAVGLPAIFACGKGLEPGTAIEFEVTMNYAIYGIPTFQTGVRGATDVAVGADQVSSTVQNGMRDLVQPSIVTAGRENAKGVASVVKAEQMSGGMPKGPGALQSIVGGVKAAVPVIESITGTSIGETIAEVLGGLGALLL